MNYISKISKEKSGIFAISFINGTEAKTETNFITIKDLHFILMHIGYEHHMNDKNVNIYTIENFGKKISMAWNIYTKYFIKINDLQLNGKKLTFKEFRKLMHQVNDGTHIEYRGFNFT